VRPLLGSISGGISTDNIPGVLPRFSAVLGEFAVSHFAGETRGWLGVLAFKRTDRMD